MHLNLRGVAIFLAACVVDFGDCTSGPAFCALEFFPNTQKGREEFHIHVHELVVFDLTGHKMSIPQVQPTWGAAMNAGSESNITKCFDDDLETWCDAAIGTWLKMDIPGCSVSRLVIYNRREPNRFMELSEFALAWLDEKGRRLATTTFDSSFPQLVYTVFNPFFSPTNGTYPRG